MADYSRSSRRSRSRSPRETSHSHRVRSPHRHHKKRTAEPAANLPLNARPLTKHDYRVFKPLLAVYLDLQKHKVLEELDETEAKGRWKSFLGKWNRGELSEGYYDPSMLQRAQQAAEEPIYEPPSRPKRGEPPRLTPPVARSMRPADGGAAAAADKDSDSDDSIGPELPGQESRSRGRVGPRAPRGEDLQLKREMEDDDRVAQRQAGLNDIRYERKLDRKSQKEALDELVPRAEAGTRERQLEKKKEVNEKMKSFRERSPGAAEVPDQELMGGGDGAGEYKKIKENFERKKNERELRREENMRARYEEREERLSEYRAKEDKTMAMLKELARQRFGSAS